MKYPGEYNLTFHPPSGGGGEEFSSGKRKKKKKKKREKMGEKRGKGKKKLY